MNWKLQRPDPDRSRRRLQLLAELADAKSVRERVQPRRQRVDRLRELIADPPPPGQLSPSAPAERAIRGRAGAPATHSGAPRLSISGVALLVAGITGYRHA